MHIKEKEIHQRVLHPEGHSERGTEFQDDMEEKSRAPNSTE